MKHLKTNTRYDIELPMHSREVNCKAFNFIQQLLIEAGLNWGSGKILTYERQFAGSYCCKVCVLSDGELQYSTRKSYVSGYPVITYEEFRHWCFTRDNMILFLRKAELGIIREIYEFDPRTHAA